MTAAKPPARQRAVGALASGIATAELHHHVGHDLLHIGVEGMRHNDIMQEMIVDVASAEGLASPRTFRKSFVAWMIEDRRAYPEGVWTKKHAEANRLQALLDGQPDLFI